MGRNGAFFISGSRKLDIFEHNSGHAGLARGPGGRCFVYHKLATHGPKGPGVKKKGMVQMPNNPYLDEYSTTFSTFPDMMNYHAELTRESQWRRMLLLSEKNAERKGAKNEGRARGRTEEKRAHKREAKRASLLQDK